MTRPTAEPNTIHDPRAAERGAEVRFPPPFVFLAAVLLGVALHMAIGALAPTVRGLVVRLAGVPLVLIGFGFGFAARQLMVRSGQSPKPWLPAPTLLLSGAYRFSRNPMYAGLMLVQLGLGFLLGNFWIVLLAPVSLLIVHVTAVLPEEKYLSARFGESYVSYLAKVRRYFPTPSIIRWFIAGVVATAIMDAGSALVRLTGFTAGLTPPLIGRWFALLVRGEAPVSDIAAAPPVPGEVPIAIVGHYAIGTGLTLLFAALMSVGRMKPATRMLWLCALGMGFLTSLLPWLWMFPSMGYGLFGQSAPPELMLLRTSLVNHLFFGLGLAVVSRWAGARR